MKNILFIAAENEEIQCAIEAFENFKECSKDFIKVDFISTGIGTTITSYKLTKAILKAETKGEAYDLIIEIGLAGSYDLKKLPVRSAALVTTEYAADLGFDSEQDGIKTLFDCGYWDKNTFPFTDGGINRPSLPYKNLENLLNRYIPAKGVSVQTVTGEPNKLKNNRNKFHADVESMEGWAVYYIAQLEGIPFFEIRTISNAVGVSDSSKWDNEGARQTLKACCKDIIENLLIDLKIS